MVGNTIGGGSAYWTSWTFDAIGNRVAQIQRNLSGGTDNMTNYQYDGNGKNQPHTLTSTTSTAPNPGTSYAYDESGNMTSRNAGQGAQALTWNDSAQLTKVSDPVTGHFIWIARSQHAYASLLDLVYRQFLQADRSSD